jgi:CRISPR-associated protein Csd2
VIVRYREGIGLIERLRHCFDIYVKEKTVLGRAHLDAFKSLDIQLGKESKFAVEEKLKESMEEVEFPGGLSFGFDSCDGCR